jgi:phage terminase large subunit-like protein
LLKVDRDAIASLPKAEQDEALRLLADYEKAIAENPLLAYQPHPKQVTFHDSQEPLKAFFGGNQSGKTTAGILDDVIQAVDEDVVPDHLKPYKKFQPPFQCRIVCPGEDIMFGIVHQKLREWCPKGQLVGGRFDKAYEKSRGILHFKNGSYFDFLTYGQDLDKFGGATKDRIHYDEEPPEAIRREGQMRLMARNGDELFTMTPFSGMGWMFDEIWEPWVKHQLPEAIVVVVDMDDNPYLHPDAKARALRTMSKEEREARKEGKFVHFAGMIYGEFQRHLHVIPEVSEVPPGSRIYVGIDPGMRHMAAVIWTYLTPEDTMVCFDELALQGHTVKQVAEAIKLRNLKWGQGTQKGTRLPLQPDWYVIDPSARNVMHQTGRSDQMEFTDHGVVTILGQNSVTAGINRVKERLQAHRLLICANCQVTIDQFRRYRWATPNRSEDDPKERPVKSDDHMLDALRYVVASRPHSPQAEAEDQLMSPMERQAREDMTGKSWNRRKTQTDPNMGAIYA